MATTKYLFASEHLCLQLARLVSSCFDLLGNKIDHCFSKSGICTHTYRYKITSATRLVSIRAANKERVWCFKFQDSNIILALFWRFALHPAHFHVLLTRWPLKSLFICLFSLLGWSVPNDRFSEFFHHLK